MDGAYVNGELQRLAREHHGRDTQALQVLYAIEGFLRRLSASDYGERMVLKGGMLLAVLDARRMTRDADLSAHGIANDESSVAEIVGQIASTTLAEPDGIEFDTTAVSTEPMRESAAYRGVRAKLPATIDVARVVVTLDLSFGDPARSRRSATPRSSAAPAYRCVPTPLKSTASRRRSRSCRTGSRWSRYARAGRRLRTAVRGSRSLSFRRSSNGVGGKPHRDEAG